MGLKSLLSTFFTKAEGWLQIGGGPIRASLRSWSCYVVVRGVLSKAGKEGGEVP